MAINEPKIPVVTLSILSTDATNIVIQNNIVNKWP